MKKMITTTLMLLTLSSFAQSLTCVSDTNNQNRPVVDYHLLNLDFQGNDVEMATVAHNIPVELGWQKGHLDSFLIYSLVEWISGEIEVTAFNDNEKIYTKLTPLNMFGENYVGEVTVFDQDGKEKNQFLSICIEK